jgi:1-deoxy-D-xylulose-5-phosphate synthase
MKAKYQLFRRTFDATVKKIPYIGDLFFAAIVRLKRAVKAVFYTDNFFVDLGFEYAGPIEGHNLEQLVEVMQDARDLGKPVVIHVITRKGKGFSFAEDDPGSYHGVGSFSAHDGLSAQGAKGPSFTEVFSAAVVEAARRDGRIAAVTAAMEKGTGLTPFKAAFPERFFDVGIAEEHAVTFSAGMAARGLRPLTAVYSTFLQRAVDGVLHDVCLQNLPVTFALDRSGFVSDDGETHQGLYDISLFRSAPNLTILAPAGKEEFILMLNSALSGGGGISGPCIIRYPKAACPQGDPAFSLPLEKGRGVWVRRAGQGLKPAVCIAFSGGLYPQALNAREILSRRGIGAGLYNLRFLKPVDEEYLAEIMDSYDFVVFAEEGVKTGGFGEYAASLALARGCSARVIVLGARENFEAQGSREELIRLNGLDGESLAGAILAFECAAPRERAIS